MHILVFFIIMLCVRLSNALNSAIRVKRVLRRHISAQMSSGGIELEETMFRELQASCGVNAGTRILLCVSGGVDSMAMLHAMANVRQVFTPPLRVEVAHFNHGKRDESPEEAEFVAHVVRTYNMPLHLRAMTDKDAKDSSENDNDAQPSSSSSSSFQDRARGWRRRHCLDILNEWGEDNACIMTAHHREDQMETVLLRILRGAHLSSLAGMRPRKGHFVKPLLSLSKNDLVAYMHAHQWEWREDVSNALPTYTRNALRLDVMPALEKIAGSPAALSRRLTHLSSQSLSLEHELVQVITDTLLKHAKDITVVMPREEDGNRRGGRRSRLEGDPLAPLRVDLPVPLLLEGLTLLQCTKLVHVVTSVITGVVLPADGVAAALQVWQGDEKGSGCGKGGASAGAMALSGGWAMARVGGVVRFSRRKTDVDAIVSDADAGAGRDVPSTISGKSSVPNVTLSTVPGTAATLVVARDGGEAEEKDREQEAVEGISVSVDGSADVTLSLNRVQKQTHIHVRAPKPGDRFRPHWRNGATVRLVDFLRGQRVPLHQRGDVRVVIVDTVDTDEPSNSESEKGSVVAAVAPFVGIDFSSNNDDGSYVEDGQRVRARLVAQEDGSLERKDGTWLAQRCTALNLYVSKHELNC